MWRIFIIVLTTAILTLGAYAAIALRSDKFTDAHVKLLGPGITPGQCEDRIRPHFEKIEPTMTKVADQLLNSADISEVALMSGQNDEFYIVERATGNGAILDPDQVIFDPQDFYKLSEAGYYATVHFREREGVVSAPAPANCGVPLYQWVRLRLGLGWSEDSVSLPVAITAYTYDPYGAQLIDQCPASISELDPALFCQIRLSKNWIWALAYYDYSQMRSKENDSQ